jgi:hypothetical protein
VTYHPAAVLFHFSGGLDRRTNPSLPADASTNNKKIGWLNIISEVYAIVRHFTPHFSSGSDIKPDYSSLINFVRNLKTLQFVRMSEASLIAAGRSATAPRIGYRRVISRENQVG